MIAKIFSIKSAIYRLSIKSSKLDHPHSTYRSVGGEGWSAKLELNRTRGKGGQPKGTGGPLENHLFFSKKSQHCIKEGKEKGFVKHSKNPFVDCKACDKPLGYVKLPRRGMQKFTDAKGQSK